MMGFYSVFVQRASVTALYFFPPIRAVQLAPACLALMRRPSNHFFAFLASSSSSTGSAGRFVPADTTGAFGFFLTTTPFIRLRTSFLIALGGIFGRGGAGGAVLLSALPGLITGCEAASSAAVFAASCLA